MGVAQSWEECAADCFHGNECGSTEVRKSYSTDKPLQTTPLVHLYRLVVNVNKRLQQI